MVTFYPAALINKKNIATETLKMIKSKIYGKTKNQKTFVTLFLIIEKI
jgi:hypothetical protein